MAFVPRPGVSGQASGRLELGEFRSRPGGPGDGDDAPRGGPGGDAECLRGRGSLGDERHGRAGDEVAAALHAGAADSTNAA
eukprot:2661839-Alexandrium_andersonii.AAC.1